MKLRINRTVVYHRKSKHDPTEPDLAKKNKKEKTKKKSEKIIVASKRRGCRKSTTAKIGEKLSIKK